MAGMWFLSLLQRSDVNGRPYVGAKAYFFEAGTLTPLEVYQDASLGTPHPNPVLSDGNGIFPAVFLDENDGSYRSRITTSGGVVLTDTDSIPIFGPTGSGGSSGTPVDANALFSAGDVLWRPTAGPRNGWVRANGRTIGSATSGATERANADAQALFEYLRSEYSDSICPVSGGRGASASADWSANKTIGLLDMRGRAPFGLDDMGASVANRITTGTPTTAASTGGADLHTLSNSEMPVHSHGGLTGVDSPDHTHNITDNISGPVSLNDGFITAAAWGSGSRVSGGANARHNHSINSDGGGASHNNMPPFMLGTWHIKL